MNIKDTLTPQELEETLEYLGLSNAALAQLLGMTQPAVDHWLTGRRSVPPTVVKLLNFFRKHPELINEF